MTRIYGASLAERLAQAASRMEQDTHGAEPGAGPYSLRREQVAVFRDFARYLADVVGRPARAGPPFCRIVLPPRTGKTVIAGHIIARSGLTATVIVPTRTLVEQTARVLGELLPGVAVGVAYGSRRAVVDAGVNVTTYSFLEHAGLAAIPAPLRQAELVFADEAHHAMTRGRQRLLHEGFEPGALRIALTATPDYDGARRLANVFPDLVHEIDLCEAMELDLLAPLRVWVAEVDEDASRVQLLGGDYEQATLGRLMSSAPFFRAAEVFRYGHPEAELSALIACASRQQAYDLQRYLAAHRPAGRPRPALILGETPSAERQELLARFERGEVDTLIQVGVLLEGWSSPRCKLLIDLAPTASRVRATQKSFRVMTRHGDAEARIYVLLPKHLPSEPLLPMDLFGELDAEYVCGARLRKKGSGGAPPPLETHERSPIAGVELKRRLLMSSRFAKPELDRENARQIRRVLESCPEFHPGCGVHEFRALGFSHRLFTGRGDFLLSWLGVPATRAGMDALLGRFYAEEIGSRLLADAGGLEPELGAEDEAAAWRAFGEATEPAPTPEEELLAAGERERVRRLVGQLKPRFRDLVIRRFGLDGGAECTLNELGELEEVSRERVRQMLVVSLRQLRRAFLLRSEDELALEHGLSPERRARLRRGVPGTPRALRMCLQRDETNPARARAVPTGTRRYR